MNRLANETSPYLLQHKDNPVDWYPWGEEALSRAVAENKPILLSIGYSACHWCHVMAHESFADTPTAQVMNRLFINIKLDREERPDLDKIYQTSHQLLTQRGGGWPLTVFLTPDQQLPFFAGTYFPKESQHGMPAFTELLVQLANYYETHQQDLAQQGSALLNALQSIQPEAPVAGTVLNAAPLAAIREQLAANFDKDWGGFGTAPKFPHPANLERLLRHWRSTANSSEPDVDALFMTALTLTQMQNGGLFDQIGGGFFRYSVDQRWQIPHFEKMLYDNGPLLALTAQLWQASGDDAFRRVASATADWLLREMRSPEGAFYAALDADSAGAEGSFYLWTPDEIAALLDSYEYTAAEHLYGLRQAANFAGQWHLSNRLSLDELMEHAGYTRSKLKTLLDSAQQKLLAVRNQRTPPATDKKILTAWNALTVRGLAIAGGALDRHELITAAAAAIDFIRSHMVVGEQLKANYAAGKTGYNAYLDDYALLLDATIELLQHRWDIEHLNFAIWLADQLMEHFADNEDGGFFFTAHNHEQLLYRPKSFSDDSMPSGNGVAALVLNRLGHLLAEPRYLQAAEATLLAGWASMQEFPHGHATLITALDEYLAQPEIIIVSGIDAGEWCHAIRQVYAPGRLCFAITEAAGLPTALAAKTVGERTVAFICKGTNCSAPVEALEELATALTRG
jgi:uncharacterized protein